jgi:hypothetical protein
MNTKQIFWGVFLISIGFLVLLRNYLNLDFDLGDIWKLWPIVFIFIGINLMMKNAALKSIMSALTALVLAIALYASVAGVFGWIRDDVEFEFNNDDYDVSEYTAPFEKGIKNSRLWVEAGAGSFRIEDSTSELFHATVEGKRTNYSLTTETNENTSDLHFKMGSTKFFLKNKNRVELRLNTQPVWDLEFDIGAAAVDFDLTSYDIENLDIEMGAASLKLRLGSKNDESNVRIDAGASSIIIEVPEEAGCEINAEVSLSSSNFSGFTKIRDNLYRTDNYDNSEKKIILDLKSGVSSINVSRYSW